ncbi:MAG: mannose-1-phosphate guanylyltransferase [Candidatus Riflebacteria bacterium]|nr:mannose-1-phosphate guanylyltransferase [Candidatus Riflebacteria bacterium]
MSQGRPDPGTGPDGKDVHPTLPAIPLYAVLMAGGSGTRFWPASRERTPKQLIKLSGQRSLIQETFDRVRPLADPEHILVVTSRAHATAVARHLPELPRDNLLIEPVGRNTAACAGLAAPTIHARHPKAAIALFPADHKIVDWAGWQTLIEGAWRLIASTDAVITFGLTPTRPETGYGYIRVGAPIDHSALPGLCAADAFVEKPDLERARQFLESGRHLWNSGVFVLRVRTLMVLISEHLPELSAGLHKIAWASPGPSRQRVMRRVYPGLPSVSIDKGIMEKAALLVAPANVGWSDVGSWSALGDVLSPDEQGNVVVGPAMCVNSAGCIVYSSGPLVTMLEVSDLIVVQTSDAILVCPKSRAQDVRLVVDQLRAQGKTRLL